MKTCIIVLKNLHYYNQNGHVYHDIIYNGYNCNCIGKDDMFESLQNHIVKLAHMIMKIVIYEVITP
jgi:hypothetical protein